MNLRNLFLVAALLPRTILPENSWPALKGGVDHAGRIQGAIKVPYHLAWADEFEGERIGTAVEPILAAGKVFIATHAGNLYALDLSSGEAIWRFHANGPFLQSPACAGELVIAASTDGSIYAINMKSGELAWSFEGPTGGFAAAPIIAGDQVFIGSRSGNFYSVSLATGKKLWQIDLNAPIRQTAGFSGNCAFVASEDLRLHCFDGKSGKELWHSDPMYGQTVRDYYPIAIRGARRNYIVVRTNPLLNMGQRIGRDRTMLCRNAGIDDSSWQKLDAWIKSDAARGTPALWDKEQEGIRNYLAQNPDAQTFYLFDAETGQRLPPPPVLWIAGCQGVGAESALTPDGRLLVFYRSAYGNWNHGVAPLVALGLLDLEQNKITPLFHQQGTQPQWNCFWGTADESQNFVVCGHTILIVHQGTLSGFDLKENRLFPIFGERDTYGGFRSPSWARNEWHGPGRGGVAIIDQRIYWITGSRLLCLESGNGKNTGIKTVGANNILGREAGPAIAPKAAMVKLELEKALDEVLRQNWAPLFVDPGLSGRDFSFDDSGEYFEALAFAYPHLDRSRQERVRTYLRALWEAHPPFTAAKSLSLPEGNAREWFKVPEAYRGRLGTDPQPHPFGNLWRVWFWARRCGEEKAVLAEWEGIRKSYESFDRLKWKLDPQKGDLFANRYTASLLAFGQIADLAHDIPTASEAKAAGEQAMDRLIEWWKAASAKGTLRSFKGSGELDPFITRGDSISFKVAPHRHKIALFRDLTPELAGRLAAAAPEAALSIRVLFTELYQTWHLVGEERQVHFGENFVDPPDLALGGFKDMAWLEKAKRSQLLSKVDLPFCRADLSYIEKLAIALETAD